MADTATYAGAMKTLYPSADARRARSNKLRTNSVGTTTPYTAKGRGDRRPPTGTGGHSKKVRRQATANIMRGTPSKRKAVSPGPKAVPNIRPV